MNRPDNAKRGPLDKQYKYKQIEKGARLVLINKWKISPIEGLKINRKPIMALLKTTIYNVTELSFWSSYLHYLSRVFIPGWTFIHSLIAR